MQLVKSARQMAMTSWLRCFRSSAKTLMGAWGKRTGEW